MSKDNLVMRIIMQANDKASAAFKNIQMAGTGLSGSLLKTKNELKDLNRTMGKADTFANYQNQFKSATRAVQENERAIAKLANEIKKSGQPTKQQINDMGKLEKKAQDLAHKETNLKDKVALLSRELKKAGFDTNNFAQSQVKAKQQTGNLSAQIDKQRHALEKLNNAEKKYQNVMTLRSNMRSTGASAFFTGGATMAAGMGVMKAGYDFERDFTNVIALLRLDKTKNAKEIAELKKDALHYGETTQFTSAQVAQGQGYLAMAGFNKDQIMKAIPTTLDLAIATSMENNLGRVSDILSDIMGANSIAADKAQYMADILTATATRTNTTLETLYETSKYVDPVARSLGQTIESAYTMTGLLGSAGIKGSSAGTALRSINLDLGTGNKALKKLGVTVDDGKGNLRQVPEILFDINKKLEGKGSIERTSIISEIFSKIPIAAAMKLMKEVEAGKYEELYNELVNAEGSTKQTADIKKDTLKGDIDNLLSAKEAISISIFDQNSGAMRLFVQDLTEILRKINMWVKANPQLTATLFKVVAVGSILLTIFGAMAMALSMVIGPLALLRLSWAKLFIGMGSSAGTITKIFMLLKTGIMSVGRVFLMNPIGLAIVGIIAALYLLWKYWEQVKTFMVNAWQSIDAVFSQYPIVNYISPVIHIARLLINNWQAVVDFFAGAWQSIQAFFSSGIGNITATIVNWSPVGLFYRAFAAVMNYLGVDIPAKMTGFGQMIVQGLINGIKNRFPVLSKVWSGVSGLFNSKMRDANDIRSPSRVMSRLGHYIMQGLEVGVLKGKSGLANTYDKAIGLFQNPITTGGFLDRAVSTLMPEGNQMHPQLAGAIAVPSGGFAQGSRERSAIQMGGDNITIQIIANDNNVGSVRREIEKILKERDLKKRRQVNSSFRDKD